MFDLVLERYINEGWYCKITSAMSLMPPVAKKPAAGSGINPTPSSKRRRVPGHCRQRPGIAPTRTTKLNQKRDAEQAPPTKERKRPGNRDGSLPRLQ